jgi:DNA-directed RNA polymerase specialized sigma24 family protein
MPKAARVIDELILAEALNYTRSADKMCERVMELTDRKIKILGLRVIIDGLLKKIPCKRRNAVRLVTVAGCSFEDAAERMEISVRAVYRFVEDGIDRLCAVMEEEGFDERWYEREYAGEPYVDRLMKAC